MPVGTDHSTLPVFALNCLSAALIISMAWLAFLATKPQRANSAAGLVAILCVTKALNAKTCASASTDNCVR